MGRKRLPWILVLLFCPVLCIGSIVAKNIHPFAQIQAEPMQADLEWLEEIKQMLFFIEKRGKKPKETAS